MLSRTGFARRAEEHPGSTPICSSPHAAESTTQDQEQRARASLPGSRQNEVDRPSFAQQAAAAEAAWMAKRQQRGPRRTTGQSDRPSTIFMNTDSTQRDIESPTSTQASSLLSLSLSASLQEIDSEGFGGERGVRDRAAFVASSASSLSSSGPSQTTPVHNSGEDCQRGRARVFPCNSDSDWYNSVPAPFCGTDKVGGPRCSQLVLSKVPRSLRAMVRSWQRLQRWLQKTGLEGRAEPWLCIVARLADTGAFEALMQSLLPTKVGIIYSTALSLNTVS